jgi:hypothetical protein
MREVVDEDLEVDGTEAAVIPVAEDDFKINCLRPIPFTISNWTLKT